MKVEIQHNPDSRAPNRITAFIHCGQCQRERPAAAPAETWARLTVGFTPNGVQLWCLRHNCNVDDLTLALIPRASARRSDGKRRGHLT